MGFLDRLIPGRIKGSYAAKLGVALLTTILITVAFGGFVFVETSKAVEEDTNQDLKTVTDMQANELDEWIGGLERQARTISKSQIFSISYLDQIDTKMEDLMQSGNFPDEVKGLHYVNTTSMVIERSSFDKLEGKSPREQGVPWATDPPEFESANDVFISDPFQPKALDEPVIAFISPIPEDKHHAFVIMSSINERTQSFRQPVEGGSTTVVDKDHRFVVHQNVSKIGDENSGGGTAIRKALNGSTGVMKMKEEGMVMSYAALENKDWVVMVHAPISNAYGLNDQIESGVIGLILITLINLALVGVTIGSNTSVSLRILSEKAKKMAEGNLDVDLENDKEDEIGELYDSFDNMRNSLREKIEEAEEAKELAEKKREEAESAKQKAEMINQHLENKAENYSKVMDKCAEGDLTRRVSPKSESDAMTSIGKSFNSMMDEIEETVATVKQFAYTVASSSEEVNSSADEVQRASQEISESVQEISDGANNQNRDLQKVSSEMSNLSATIEEVASSSEDVSKVSRQAAEAGEEGRKAAENAIDEMGEVEQKTDKTVEEIEKLDQEMEKIGEIVEVISDIAEQTNILALNASIEAARAGEAGEGFAVVADEVKSLAEETKEAAGEIEGVIEDVQGQTETTVEDMKETSERVTAGVETVENAIQSLEEIVEYVEDTNAGIQEINHAAEEQATSTQEVVSMVDDVATISEETTAEAENVAAAAEEQTSTITEVATSTEDLTERAEELRNLLEDFRVGESEIELEGETVSSGTIDDINEEVDNFIDELSGDFGTEEGSGEQESEGETGSGDFELEGNGNESDEDIEIDETQISQEDEHNGEPGQENPNQSDGFTDMSDDVDDEIDDLVDEFGDDNEV